MAMFSVGQAARLVGCGKSTITRAIKSGRVSATRLEDGRYEIDASELMRVYKITPEALEKAGETGETVTPPVSVVHHATPAGAPPATPQDPEVTARLAALDAEVKGLRELLTEVKESREQWRAQAERLALMAPAAAPERPRSWWRRLAG